MISGRSSLVVRHYAPISSKKGKERQPLDDELLSKGRDLVSAVEAPDKWRAVCPTSDVRESQVIRLIHIMS